MRLLFLTNIPAPYRTAFFDSLDAACRAGGHRLSVLYCATTEPRRHWPYEPWLMAHRHEVMAGIHPVIRGWHTHLNPGVLGALSRHRPDLVVVGGAWNTPTMLMGLSWCRTMGVPVLFWSEGHADAVLKAGNPLVSLLRRKAYGSFDGYLTPNGKSSEWAMSQGGREVPCLSLPNSIDTAFFTPPPGTDKSRLRADLGLDPEARVLIQVARVDAIKAPLELARAFMGLRADQRAGAQLVFVGNGSLLGEAREIEASSQGRIRCAGNIDAPRVREWLWASDVFVLNTRRDPNPLSPIEASAARLPVLLSEKAGNARELVAGGDAGWIIGNPDDPSLELGRVLDLPAAEIARMGARAHANAVSHFDARSVAQNLLAQLAIFLRRRS